MLDFDENRIPVDARYAAHRIAALAPTHLLDQANRYLDDPEFASLHETWARLRENVLALLQRCNVALRRLEGTYALAPETDEDLGLFVGIRAPIVDALRALILTNEAWMHADREALQHYSTVRDQLLDFYAELQERIVGFELANARLRAALATFAPLDEPDDARPPRLMKRVD